MTATSTQYIQLIVIMLGFGLLEDAMGRAQEFKATSADNVEDLVGFVLLAALAQPFIMWATNRVGLAFMPEYKDVLKGMLRPCAVVLFLLFVDMLQHWWHRLSHGRLLWPLHRAHHTAHHMSARIIYRNNFVYYMFMLAIWGSALLVCLGLIEVYLVYIVVKLAVITSAHIDVRWDEPLYRVKALRPLMWVVQRTNSTPATHFVHHAMINRDGVGHDCGNVGNQLFFWDVLFGTAHITPHFPTKSRTARRRDMESREVVDQVVLPPFMSGREATAMKPGGQPYGDADDIAREQGLQAGKATSWTVAPLKPNRRSTP